MTNSQIKRILNGIGYSTDEVIQVNGLRALLFTTNQGVHPHETFLYFDSTSNIIKIKKYNYKVISGRISNSVSINGTEITSRSTIYLRHSVYPFRAPRVGDTIFIINASTGKIVGNKTKITSASQFSITTENPLPIFDKEKQFIVYADSSLIDKAVQDKEVYPLFFVYKALTENNFDIFLDGNFLLGLELSSAIVGSV